MLPIPQNPQFRNILIILSFALFYFLRSVYVCTFCHPFINLAHRFDLFCFILFLPHEICAELSFFFRFINHSYSCGSPSHMNAMPSLTSSRSHFYFSSVFCKRKPLTTPLSCRLSFSTTTTTDATFSFIYLLFPSLLTQNVLFLCNMCLLSFGFVCLTFFRILYFCVILHGIMFVCWLLGVYGHAFNVLSFARNECCGTFLLRPSIRPWPTKRTTIMLLYAVTNWYPLCTCTSLEICHFVRWTHNSTFFAFSAYFIVALWIVSNNCAVLTLAW